jgi:hypothetical protein
MSRLLFAAARGARIEAEWKGIWSGVAGIHLVPKFNYRIHPADAHLQYGPISTALREMAEDARAENQPSWEMGLANFSANKFIDYYEWRWCEPDYPLYYLILAEFLADEGM